MNTHFFESDNIIQNKFNSWNILKQKVHKKEKEKFYVKQREVWSVIMGQNIWFEEDWKWKDFERPVLVLKKIWIVYLCVAMTTKWKNNDFYHKLKDSVCENSYIILSQPKLLDIKRFHYKIETIHEEDFLEIQKKLKNLWF